MVVINFYFCSEFLFVWIFHTIWVFERRNLSQLVLLVAHHSKWLGKQQFCNLVKISKTIIEELSVGDEKYNFISNYVFAQGDKYLYRTGTYKCLTFSGGLLKPRWVTWSSGPALNTAMLPCVGKPVHGDGAIPHCIEEPSLQWNLAMPCVQ